MEYQWRLSLRVCCAGRSKRIWSMDSREPVMWISLMGCAVRFCRMYQPVAEKERRSG